MNVPETPDSVTLDRLFVGIQDRIRSTSRRDTRRHRLGAVAAAGALTVALTGGTAAIIQATATEKSVSDCFAAADLSARHTSVAQPPTNGIVSEELSLERQRAAQAEEMCGAVWRIGFFDSGEPPTDGTTAQVPSLTVCVLGDGRMGVFPASPYGDGTCEKLRLRVPGSEST